MNKSVFEYIGNLDTLIAVVIGAMLATMGALFAELIQDRLNRRRRERDAARFFGEILFSIDRILDSAFASQKIGDPWGSVTQRMFKMAIREADVYHRNRERLFDIRDTGIRTRIHQHFLTELFPLEAVAEYSDELAAINGELQSEGLPKAREEALALRARELAETRAQSLAFLVFQRNKTVEICGGLVKLAGVDFGNAPTSEAAAPPAAVGAAVQGSQT